MKFRRGEANWVSPGPHRYSMREPGRGWLPSLGPDQEILRRGACLPDTLDSPGISCLRCLYKWAALSPIHPTPSMKKTSTTLRWLLLLSGCVALQPTEPTKLLWEQQALTSTPASQFSEKTPFPCLHVCACACVCMCLCVLCMRAHIHTHTCIEYTSYVLNLDYPVIFPQLNPGRI